MIAPLAPALPPRGRGRRRCLGITGTGENATIPNRELMPPRGVLSGRQSSHQRGLSGEGISLRLRRPFIATGGMGASAPIINSKKFNRTKKLSLFCEHECRCCDDRKKVKSGFLRCDRCRYRSLCRKRRGWFNAVSRNSCCSC